MHENISTIKMSQRKIKIHLNNSHVINHENATNSQINLNIETSQNKRNPRHKSKCRPRSEPL